MTDIVERLKSEQVVARARDDKECNDVCGEAADEIERLRAALREIAAIEPRTIDIQTDYGTDTYRTLVDDKAISIARAALKEGKDD